ACFRALTSLSGADSFRATKRDSRSLRRTKNVTPTARIRTAAKAAYRNVRGAKNAVSFCHNDLSETPVGPVTALAEAPAETANCAASLRQSSHSARWEM